MNTNNPPSGIDRDAILDAIAFIEALSREDNDAADVSLYGDQDDAGTDEHVWRVIGALGWLTLREMARSGDLRGRLADLATLSTTPGGGELPRRRAVALIAALTTLDPADAEPVRGADERDPDLSATRQLAAVLAAAVAGEIIDSGRSLAEGLDELRRSVLRSAGEA